MNDHEVSLTWWGASSIEIGAGSQRLAIDPFGEPAEPRVHCVCVTREDHDHFDVETLRRLVTGQSFERLVVPLSCTAMDRLDAPLAPGAQDLAFVPRDRVTVLFARYGRSPAPEGAETGIEVAGFRVEAVQSSERGQVSTLDGWQRYRSPRWTAWPGGDGPFVGLGQYRPIGYVVTHVGSGLTVYHPGDLQEVYDCHFELRGRIDYLFLPVASAAGVEVSLVDALRPRFVVPIHYRSEGETARVRAGQVVDVETGYPLEGADPEAYRSEMQQLISERWFPSPKDALRRMAQLTPEFSRLGAKLVVLKAGETLSVGTHLHHTAL